ncbi:glycyl-radical enzyme activating protein [Desulfosarcina ovata subsp. ovata]|uniref:Glycyl-radical enzyme activating protein n=2 Tax=Desulfosarcina ovata TaxID=83564 RepID=A0A5K8A679_9BACT|nr:glycyl-radical enzyme activating protein [Desulfosarcina ovata subsp. ovata]
MRCGHCAEVCPEDVISLPGPNGEFPERDRNKCTLCMKCVDECPHGALELVGREWTIDEIIQEVEGDRQFYDNSGGGITASGGEPLFFPEFTAALLKRAKEKGIHTCLDTSGYAPWNDFERVLIHTDMVLFDLKCMDPKTHLKVTAVSNKIILQNLHKIKEIFGSTKRVRLRLPIIPGVNDDADFFESVANLARDLEDTVEGIDVLPFHNWAEGKYEQLDRIYTFAGTNSMLNEDVSNFASILKNYGFEVTVGG